MNIEQQIFAQGSRTYYTSSLLFPAAVRADVFRLYSFVRTADDYVDELPQNIEAFRKLVATWQRLRDLPMGELQKQNEDDLNTRVTKNICQLCILYHFEREWVDAFLWSMDQDTKKTTYATLHDSLEYVHGSAEVVGYMMSNLMQLSEEAKGAAAAQGRAMQWINFLRDIAEDNQLGRCYFPQEDLKQFGLQDLQEKTARKKPQAFRDFMQLELGRYYEWQAQAEQGVRFIPRRPRIAIQTASDGYRWTAKQIAKNPFVVFDRSVKPQKLQLLGYGLGHMFD